MVRCRLHENHDAIVTFEQTDQNGNFKLQVENESAVLVFSLIGYQTIEQSVNGKSEFLLSMATQHTQHMQAALDQMNIKLHHVIDDLSGVTGQAIIEAILAGHRDAHQLAKLRDKRIQASEATIVKALDVITVSSGDAKGNTVTLRMTLPSTHALSTPQTT